MLVETQGLADFVHGPYLVKAGQPGPAMPRVVAEELERAKLISIVGDAPAPEPAPRVLTIARGAVTGNPAAGKSMPAGEALPSSSSPAGQVSQAPTSSSSGSGGRNRRRKSDRGE